MPPDAADQAKDPVQGAHEECFHLRVGHIERATKRFYADADAEKPREPPSAEPAPSGPPPEADAVAADPRGDTPVETVPEIDVMQSPMYDSIIDYSYTAPEAELVNTGGLTPGLIEDFGLVGVPFNGNQMLGTWFLLQAATKWRTVGRLTFTATRPNGETSEVALGTGFLVGPGVLMTNSHVLSRFFASRAVVEFDYIDTPDDVTVPIQVHRLDPEALFVRNEYLDYVLVAVEPLSATEATLVDRGWNHLEDCDLEPMAGERVNIVQHPGGESQCVALRDNHVVRCPHVGYLHYFADTQTQSSGSPVWNDKWELVGLHHASVARWVDDEKCILYKENGERWDWQESTSHLVEWRANEGVSMHTIRTDLETRALAMSADERTRLEACFEPPPQPTMDEMHSVLTNLQRRILIPEEPLEDPIEDPVADDGGVNAALRALGAAVRPADA